MVFNNLRMSVPPYSFFAYELIIVFITYLLMDYSALIKRWNEKIKSNFYFLFQSPQTLKQLKMVQAMARKQQWYDNLANTLLSTDQPIRAQQEGEPLSEEEEKLVKALEEKYDAARDQLLAEVCHAFFNPFALSVPQESIVCYFHTFENNFWIKQKIMLHLKEICCLVSH